MKHKRLAIILATILALYGIWLVHDNWRHFFPSKQMKELRQLETSLNLPKPKFRSVEDLGYNKDGKGAPHYDRHIALTYDDVTILDKIRTKLLSDSWTELPGAKTGSDTSFSFKRSAGDATQCVQGFVNPSDSDTPLYISLEASGEYSCNPAPGI